MEECYADGISNYNLNSFDILEEVYVRENLYEFILIGFVKLSLLHKLTDLWVVFQK